jgi:hypothetical protein
MLILHFTKHKTRGIEQKKSWGISFHWDNTTVTIILKTRIIEQKESWGISCKKGIKGNAVVITANS